MLVKLFICSFVISLFLSLSVQAVGIDDCEAAYENDEGSIKIYELCEPLANKNNPIAQRILGLTNQFVLHDYTQAFKWYGLAVKKNDVIALMRMGYLYQFGLGVTTNFEDSIAYYQMVLEQDDIPEWVVLSTKHYLGFTANRLGKYFHEGQVFDFDGNLYREGENILINYNQAFSLFRLSAMQGRDVGMYNLGHMYSEGKGVEEDKVYAYIWFNLADEAGHSSAKKKREELSEKMTSKELRIAQELSQKCLDSDYKKCESGLPNFLHRKLNLSNKDKD